MNIIEQIREKIANYRLERLLKKEPHKTALYNLNTAQTAGILFDATDDKNTIVVRQLIKELGEHNIKSQALGFINKAKRNDNYIGDQTYSYACRKDFSFFYQPKKEVINTFINTPFHLMIVLEKEDLFPTQYIARLSQAAFKAGKTGLNNDMFDFMIELKEKDGLDELRKQIMHYLNILNNN